MVSVFRRIPRRTAEALALGVAISVAVTVLSRVGILAGWEARAVDTFVFVRERQPEPAIAVVAVDDEAFESLGERQPVPRDYLAELVAFLLRAGARVVAVDLVLSTPTSPPADAALIAVAAHAGGGGGGRLVFAGVARPRSHADGERFEMSRPFSLALDGGFGFSNAPVGADGVIRRMAPVLPAADGGLLPSFSLMALWSRDAPPDALDAALRSSGGAITLPARVGNAGAIAREPISRAELAGSTWRIDYTGLPGSLATFPSTPLVQMARNGVNPPADNPFQGKIVIVGATFAESRDFYPTPVGLMSGVEIQANMVHTLLSRRALTPPHWAASLAVLTGLCVGTALLSLWLRPAWLAAASLALVALLAVLSYEAYVRRGYWLDCVGPVVAMVGYLQLSRLLARRRLRSAFGQYVSAEIVERVLAEGSRLGGELRVVSVMMSDVRGFTTLSERLSPAQVSEIMNEYFAAMADVIMEHRGVINDFIGDGILAVFGAPVEDPDHALHAVESALGMQAALRRLNAGWAAAGRPTLTMGVAVNTGEAFVGNMGSARRKKYSVLGDTVNTVSRIESQNRELSTEILISAGTLAMVKDRVTVRDRGAVTLKGKTQPAAIFELLEDARAGAGRDRPTRSTT